MKEEVILKSEVLYRYSRLKETYFNENNEEMINLFIQIKTITLYKIDDQIISEQIITGPVLHIEEPKKGLTIEICELPNLEDRFYITKEEYERLSDLLNTNSNEFIFYNIIEK